MLAAIVADNRGMTSVSPRENIRLQQFQNLPEAVHDHLHRRIFDGDLAAGEPLRQEEIATRLGISRVPVREALKRLESEGLVVLRPRCGYVVASLDPVEIEEIFEVRKLLETHAGRLAAQRRTEEDIRDAERLLHAMDRLLKPTAENVRKFAQTNRDFHRRMFVCCGRTQLCRMMDLLRDQVERYVRIDATTPGRLQEAQGEHYAIFAAFKEGNAKTVGRLCGEHCDHTLSRLTESLRRHASPGGRERAA
ncbi:MAG: GntR family transcriptional regulator [Alphaproteobacteria bacterium]